MSKRLVDLFSDLVRIDSESGEEQEFLQYLAGILKETIRADCSFDSYGNLIAHVPQKGDVASAPLLFACHADTVKPGRGIEPIVEDGVIRSKGETILGADDKAGIAQFIEAVRTATRHPALEFVVTREEEIGLVGARHLNTSMLGAKEGFVLDMDSLDAVVVGGPSHMLIDVEVSGRAAHAAMDPEKGVSAILAAANAISRMKLGRLDPETTANVGIISGGQIRNGIPDKASVKAECRSLDHDKCLAVGEAMRKAFVEAAEELGAKADVKLEMAYRASSLDEGARVVSLAKEALKAAGLKPNVHTICGGTDASIFNAAGIETVIIGTGVQAEHSTDEHILESDMDKAVGVIRWILERGE